MGTSAGPAATPPIRKQPPWCSESRGIPHPIPSKANSQGGGKGRVVGMVSVLTPHPQGLLADFLCFDSTPRTAQIIFSLDFFQQPLIKHLQLDDFCRWGLDQAGRANSLVRSHKAWCREAGTQAPCSQDRNQCQHYLRGMVPPAQVFTEVTSPKLTLEAAQSKSKHEG